MTLTKTPPRPATRGSVPCPYAPLARRHHGFAIKTALGASGNLTHVFGLCSEWTMEREPVVRHERVPEELKAYEQWVNWRMDTNRKIPVNPVTLGNAGVQWPNTWSSFEKAREIATRHQLGIGFVLTQDDPYTCVDMDNCIDQTGHVLEQVRVILNLLSGYIEVSPSGKGLHSWIRSDMQINRRSNGLEIYSAKRWITITGRCNPRAPQEIPERTAELAELIRLHFPGEEREVQNLPVGLGDEDIWQRLFRSQNGAFFESLYRGDITVAYEDHSRAVILLANHLAKVTDLDAARIKRLLYQTNLVRPKWEERRGNTTWIDHQILNAIRFVARRQR